MAIVTILDQLFALPDVASQKALLTAHQGAIDDDLIDRLKGAADEALRADAQRSLALADLLYHAAGLTENPLYRALALFAEANVCTLGGLGDHLRAVALADEAAAIYAAAQRPLDQADAQATKIFALAMLGRYAEALVAGAWASTILAQAGAWLRLATIIMNVAIVYGRMGKDQAALDHFAQAGDAYRRAGAAGEWSLPGVEMNRALVLRNLGRFDESLQANTNAIALLTDLGQTAEVGHAQQTMAFTYYVQGRYNEALSLLHEARDRFQADGRDADLLVTELYLSQCLLTLRRFADVIATCDDLCQRAANLGQRFEEGYALLNKALALAGLAQHNQALDVLTAARAVFTADTNQVWAAQAELEGARLLLVAGRVADALTQAQRCADLFAEHALPVHQASALLVVGQAYLHAQQPAASTLVLQTVVKIGIDKQLPTLLYQAYALLGQVAEAEGELETALAQIDQALAQLEQLRGRLMLEYRADFLEDKASVYAAAVRLALAQDHQAQALAYAERARSQALRDLLAQRLDLRIQPRSADDQPLVDALGALQQERDLLYRRTHYAQGFGAASTPTNTVAEEPATMTALEGEITRLWHQLLIRNADYARDALPWQSSPRAATLLAEVQAALPPGTLLLSYFVGQAGLQLFLVTQHSLTVQELPVQPAAIQRLVDLLRLNLKMVAASPPGRQPQLLANAQQILHQLYRQLLAPVAPALADAAGLIIVPHGVLHYVPFQALVTTPATADCAAHYLLDDHEISYLPGATFLRAEPVTNTGGDLIAFGHSYGGRLPHTAAEAQAIAALAGGQAFVETAATKAVLRTLAANARILHLATHGDFRADNPLFSGLALADGWLSTLDIFGLRTNAALVTLSACQTGRNVVGGGDELLGLMRAFLAAGAASLVLTMWAVHDESTALLMTHFYQALLGGATKSAALRTAQLALRDQSAYAHPYFWAPFLLVGDGGKL